MGRVSNNTDRVILGNLQRDGVVNIPLGKYVVSSIIGSIADLDMKCKSASIPRCSSGFLDSPVKESQKYVTEGRPLVL